MFIDFRGKGGERKRNINQLPPICPLTGDRNSKLGMYPEQGLNLQTFGPWDDTPTN